MEQTNGLSNAHENDEKKNAKRIARMPKSFYSMRGKDKTCKKRTVTLTLLHVISHISCNKLSGFFLLVLQKMQMVSGGAVGERKKESG